VEGGVYFMTLTQKECPRTQRLIRIPAKNSVMLPKQKEIWLKLSQDECVGMMVYVPKTMRLALNNISKLLTVVVLVMSFTTGAAACWQSTSPVLRVSASELRGVTILNGRPLVSSLSLHKTIQTKTDVPSYRQERFRTAKPTQRFVQL